jgi:anthranilate synthase component 1
MISFEAFEAIARRHNVIPLVSTILADVHTPVSIYLTLRQQGMPSFLFESVEADEKIGRFSFVGVDPVAVIRAGKGGVTTQGNALRGVAAPNIFEALGAVAGRYTQAPPQSYGSPDLDTDGLLGGFVGYLGYDNVRYLERIPIAPAGVEDEDDAVFGLFASVVRFDHRGQTITIVHNVLVDSAVPLPRLYEEGKKSLHALEFRLRKPAISMNSFSCDFAGVDGEKDRPEFQEAVELAKQHIVEGDIFQVVLSRRMKFQFGGDLFPVYRALRVINPSPYLFYLDFGETKLVGSSPEVLVRSRRGFVEVFPIAGTRRRGATEEEDGHLEEELLRDGKEIAEHVMLVDLGRNDVGKLCDYGTVEVPVFKHVERYSHVMHLVSEVRGKIRDGVTAIDILRACFPAGTVSGAPKVRAMEIINLLEKGPRGAYAGAVGYIGFNGALDMCIAIRTLVAHANMLKIQVGAGIVADSDPRAEYMETVNKSKAMLEAVKFAVGGL